MQQLIGGNPIRGNSIRMNTIRYLVLEGFKLGYSSVSRKDAWVSGSGKVIIVEI